jgi:putative PD-(D/E)XK family protein DUF4420
MTKLDSEILVQLFRSLRAVELTGLEQFSAAPIPGYTDHRIARDSAGRPSLLLGVIDAAGTNSPPPIILRHIEVQHDAHCQIKHINAPPEAATFTVIRCSSDNRLLQTMFLRVCVPVLQHLGPKITRAGVLDAVNRLVELFRSLERPATKTIVGLWAELFVIERSSDASFMVSCWHSAPSDLFDFSHSEQRLEVKASSQRARRHHFRLEQLQPPTGTCCVVASVFVDAAGRGRGIDDLVEAIGRRITDIALQDRLHGVVFQLLGDRWESAGLERFDYEAAQESLVFYLASQVPCVSLPIPRGVSEVHFKADLSAINPASEQLLRSHRGLLASVCSKQGTT